MSRYSGAGLRCDWVWLRAFHPVSEGFPTCLSVSNRIAYAWSYNPGFKAGLGLPVFARRYWQDRFRFLFLRLLRCLTSPSVASLLQRSRMRAEPSGYPIGDPWVRAYLPLLMAYRSLSLINMLKFSKYSNLTSAWKIERNIHLYGFINNMDMIKISHVMTIYTNKYIFFCVCV
jgi:hypothetical protein